MPVSIATSFLLLWSSLLLPGASARPFPGVEGTPALYRSISAASLEGMATIRACPLDEGCSWTISEADTEEEETDDGDGDRLLSESRWSSPRTVGRSLASTIRPDRGVARSAARSPILRC